MWKAADAEDMPHVSCTKQNYPAVSLQDEVGTGRPEQDSRSESLDNDRSTPDGYLVTQTWMIWM